MSASSAGLCPRFSHFIFFNALFLLLSLRFHSTLSFYYPLLAIYFVFLCPVCYIIIIAVFLPLPFQIFLQHNRTRIFCNILISVVHAHLHPKFDRAVVTVFLIYTPKWFFCGNRKIIACWN